MRVSLLLLIFVLFYFNTLIAQSSSTLSDHHNGYIKLLDGSKYSGEIKQDKALNIVQCFKTGRVYSFNAAEVSYFTFYDEEKGINRTWYAIPYDLNKNKYPVPVFFELEKTLEEFAILSQVEVEYKTELKKSNHSRKGNYVPSQLARNYGTTNRSVVRETLYFATDNGALLPFVKITRDGDAEFSSFIDKSAMASLTGIHFESLKDYAKTHLLNLKEKDHLMEVMEYYHEIHTQATSNKEIFEH